MCARSGFLVLLVALLAGFSADACAEKRVALVIGNSNYLHAPKLANPTNDAGAVSVLLEGAGFQVVETRSDLGNSEMRRAIRDFSEKTQDADMAVVYFAGHGIEVDGSNYLIPIDAKLERDIDVEDEAIALDRVLKVAEPAKGLRLVILDACRENPFAGGMKRTVATRSIGRGLAKVEPATSDTLIAFAAKAGSISVDGDGMHSPFTAAMLKHIVTPGLDLRLVFGRVREDVVKATASRQEPFVYGSLGGSNVALIGGDANAPSAAPAAASNAPQGGTVWREYELAAQANTKETWDAFLEANPTGFYSNLARAQRAKLIAAAPAPTPAPTAAPAPALADKVAVTGPAAAPADPAPTAPAIRKAAPPHNKKVEAKKKERRRSAQRGGGEGRARGSSDPNCVTIRHAIRAARSVGFNDGHGLMASASRYCGG